MLRDAAGDLSWFALQARSRDPNGLDPRHRQLLLALPVFLEGSTPAGMLPPIASDGQPRALPVEVELISLDEIVDDGPPHTCVRERRQHSLLSSGAGEAALAVHD